MAGQDLKPQEIVTRWDSGQRLRLVFVWVRDRFQLQLYGEKRESTDKIVQATLLLTSQDGTASDRWPASAPLQSLAIESRGENSVALAVGMAGKAHWSASVETRAVPDALRFDYACRLTEEPEFLGSTFQVAGPDAANRLTIEEVLGGEVIRDATTWTIASQAPMAANSIWTARWRFTLRLNAT